MLEGSCPICRIGEVGLIDDDKCNRCQTRFCKKCGGTKWVNFKYRENPNVLPCKCDDTRQKKAS